MEIVVIDGMGGGIGKVVVETIKSKFPEHVVTAVGTNSTATSVMLKAGADYAATGENAVRHNCKNADLIIGAIGIMVANAMHGEISVKIAKAVSKSKAYKILIPISKCNVTVLGGESKTISGYLENLEEEIKNINKKSEM